MAWGVMSIKEKIAIETEDYLLNPDSVFFFLERSTRIYQENQVTKKDI